MQLISTHISTPLGSMSAIADDHALYLLEFVEDAKLPQKIRWLEQRLQAPIIPGSNEILQSIKKELDRYFAGTLKAFTTPVQLLGSPFQQSVWNELQTVPFGKTCSYAVLAHAVGNITAYRAVANANGANLLSIIVPCHRIINKDGKLGGYAGGLHRKQWLLNHENH